MWLTSKHKIFYKKWPYSVGSVWRAPVVPEEAFCGRRFRWRCGSEVGFDGRDGDSIEREEVPILALKLSQVPLMLLQSRIYV